MQRRTLVVATTLVVLSSAAAAIALRPQQNPEVTPSAKAFIKTLDAEQKKVALLPYGSAQRTDWHFIPKDKRKGLQVKHMSKPQRAAAHKLLRSTLSAAGYDKATNIMKLEGLLNELEGGKGRNIRDPERYYFTVFGEPGEKARWGLSIEGHHLSLNFVLEGGEVISSTPAFFAANPGIVKNKNETVAVGTRVLRDEEQLAFDLVQSLNKQQLSAALIADKAPSEIRAAGEAQPPVSKAVGIASGDLNKQQTKTLVKLIKAYASAMRGEVYEARMKAIDDAGIGAVHFAWAGATEPGVGHYYRVQGPTFLIEFVNTQPDAAGNPANHIHCVWRDTAGDFALPIK